MADYDVSDGETSTGVILNVRDVMRVTGTTLDAGGKAFDTVINAGGQQNVTGGTADGTTINAGGLQTVLGNGLASDSVVNNGGLQFGYATSTLNGTAINYGGTQVTYGTANDSVVNDGGTQIAHGIVDDTIVNAGGVQIVNMPFGGPGAAPPDFSADFVTDTTINAGGQLVIHAGPPVVGIQLVPSAVVANVPGSTNLSDYDLIAGGTIKLAFLQYQTGSTTVSFNEATDILTVTATNTSYDLQLTGNYSGVEFQVDSDVGGNDADTGNVVISTRFPANFLPEPPPPPAPCFCRGTLIATPAGAVPVEAIMPGSQVTTLDGTAREVVWVGSGSSPAVGDNRPVIVRRGAFARGVPTRDLRVTRGHSFLFGAVLIPIGELLNGRSILWDEAARITEYHHVELAVHAILLAEDAPAESYRNDGNRTHFGLGEGTGGAADDIPPCAPVLVTGPEVVRVRARLAARAATRPSGLVRRLLEMWS